MNNISNIQKLSFKIKNIPLIKKIIESNRWAVKLYFENRYRRPDPYETKTSPLEKEKIEHIIQILNKNRYKNILDIGCGEGYLVENLLDITERITGLDISKIALKRAQKRLADKKNISFLCADILSWQTKEKFDLIISSETLYYLNPNQIRLIIPKLNNWLSPKGKLFLSHIISQEESQKGLPLKKLGAKTIHPLFINSPYFNTIYYEDCGTYIITLLEKI